MWHGPISHFGMGFCCMEPTAAIVPTASNALDQCNPSDKALACSCSESEEPHAARFMRPSFSASRGRARVRFSHAGVTVYIVCDLRCEFGEGLSLQNARAGRYKKGVSKVQKVPVPAGGRGGGGWLFGAGWGYVLIAPQLFSYFIRSPLSDAQ